MYPESTGPRETFDFLSPVKRLLAVVRRHPLLILAVVIISVGLVVGYSKLRPPIYESEAMLLAEPKDDLTRDRFYDQWNLFRKDEAESEVELLTGGAVLEAVQRELDLKWDDVHHPLGSLVRRWWQFSDLGNWYRSVKHQWFPPEKSPWDLTPEEKEKIDVLLEMKKGIRFEVAEGTHVGKLIVQGPSPRVAEIANRVAQTYIKQRAERHQAEAANAVKALEASVNDAHGRMMDIEIQLKEYREKHGVYFDFEREQAMVTHWSKIEADLVARRAELARQEEETRQLESLMQAEEKEQVTQRVEELNTLRQAMEGQVLGVKLDRETKLQRFPADAPEIKEVEVVIATLERNIAAASQMVLSSEATALNQMREALRKRVGELSAQSSGLRAEIAKLAESETVFKTRLEGLSEKQSTVQTLIRRLSEVRAEYGVLLDRKAQATVSQATAGLTQPSLRQVDVARPPQDPTWPNTKLMVAAAIIVGLIFGTLAAFLVEAVQGRVRREGWKDFAEFGGSTATLVLSSGHARAALRELGDAARVERGTP